MTSCAIRYVYFCSFLLTLILNTPTSPLFGQNILAEQNSVQPTDFVIPPPPPPPPHPMAGTMTEPEDLRSPRQKLYEQCLDHMADLPDAAEDFVQRCMGEIKPIGPPSNTSPSPNPVKSGARSQHPVPGYSSQAMTKNAETLPAVISPCYEQILKRLRKRSLQETGDSSVSVYVRDTGKVEAALVEESEFVDEQFLSCLEKSIVKSWKIPPSQAAAKRNALNFSTLIISFESVGQTQQKNKITIQSVKSVKLSGLSSREIANSLKKQAGFLRSCKANVLPPEVIAARKAGGKPTIVIDMDVEFSINVTGRVTGLSIAEISTADPIFKNCIRDRISSWVFPKPRGGQVTRVSQTLRLTPI